jgi:hypothetical protein
MAITLDMLKDLGLELSDDQAQKIVTLSENDEQAQIDKVTERIHSQYDADIKEITGKEKPGGVKSYENLKKILGGYKNDLEALKAKNKELTTAIENGKGDEAQLSQLKAELETVKNEKSALEEKVSGIEESYKTQLSQKEKEVEETIVNSLVESRLANLKFKDDEHITERVKAVLIKEAKNEVLSQNRKLTKAEDGTPQLIFLDENGLTKTNPKNMQNPLSVDDVLQNSLADILETPRQQQGGGGQPQPGGGQGGGAIRVNAKTKSEADALINTALIEAGKTPGTDEYREAYQEAYKENNISELPAR